MRVGVVNTMPLPLYPGKTRYPMYGKMLNPPVEGVHYLNE